MPLATILLAAAEVSASSFAGLAPDGVPDVVAAATACFEAVATKKVDAARLTDAGWVEVPDDKPSPNGGHAYRHQGMSGEIVAVGSACSLIAPVKSFDDVKATLLQLDDVVHPDRFEESDEGIVLTKGNRTILFYVGPPTNQTPAAVRIDAMFSEKK